MKVKIFIVDDHYMVIEGIRSLLQSEEEVEWSGHATTASSCLAFLKKQLPDVILMDVNLPDRTGVDLCKEVKELYPSIFILGLSTFNQQSLIQKMLKNGASGYLLKNASQEELMEGIRTVIKGNLYLSHEAAQSLRNYGQTAIPILTRREKEVLDLIADGLTNNEIGAKLFLSPSTVDTHRKNLMTKFEAKNVAALVKMAAHFNII